MPKNYEDNYQPDINRMLRKKRKVSRKKVIILISIMLLFLIAGAVIISMLLKKSPSPIYETPNIADKPNALGKPIPKEPEKIKIFLSPASHDPDNPCLFDEKCGESIHANIYIDYLEELLNECGFQTKRNPKTRKGKADLYKAVEDANEWGAMLYYVAHTNAFDTRTKYSLIMPDGPQAVLWGEKLVKRREEIYPRKVRFRTDNSFIESSKSDAPTIYDEIAFHDNKEDVEWFHNNIEGIAVNTAKAICEMFNVEYKGREVQVVNPAAD